MPCSNPILQSVGDDRRNRRRRERRDRCGSAGSDCRSGQPGAHREGAHRRDGRAGPLHILPVPGNFNASTVTDIATRYGSSWLVPLRILPGRLFKFGAQLDF